jgi:hypothetical protein
VRVRHLAQETKLLALDLGTRGQPRCVRHRHLCAVSVSVLTVYCESVGDIHFQAPRRFWSRTTVAPSYAYIFTDPQTNADPALGVNHGTELPYLFGNLSTSGPPNVASLSRAMLDYWISFAVSLTPNDGQGTSSTLRYVSTFCTSSDHYLQGLTGECIRTPRYGMSSRNVETLNLG